MLNLELPNDSGNISVTATTRLIKYAAGVDPEIGDPFEVIENTQVFTGQAAIDIINQLNKGVIPDAPN